MNPASNGYYIKQMDMQNVYDNLNNSLRIGIGQSGFVHDARGIIWNRTPPLAMKTAVMMQARCGIQTGNSPLKLS